MTDAPLLDDEFKPFTMTLPAGVSLSLDPTAPDGTPMLPAPVTLTLDAPATIENSAPDTFKVSLPSFTVTVPKLAK